MAATAHPSTVRDRGLDSVDSRVVPAREAASLTVLYDGTCGFCTRQARLMQRLGGKHVQLASTADPDVLARYPGLTSQATNRQMYVHEAVSGGPDRVPGGHPGDLRAPDSGRMYGGATAVARLVREVPIIGPVGWLYYVPGLRQIADAGYRLVARNRHRLSRVLGWQPLPNDSCGDGACALPRSPEAA